MRLPTLALLAAAAAAPAADAPPDPLPPFARLRLGTDRFRLPYPGGSMALSPDASKLVVSTGSGLIPFDAATGRRGPLVPDYSGSGSVHFVGPDRVALAGYNGVRVVGLSDPPAQPNANNAARNFGNLSTRGATVASGDGKRGAVVGVVYKDQTQTPKAIVFDGGSGAVVAEFEPVHTEPALAALSADGKLLATGGRYYDRTGRGQVPADSGPNVVQLWDVTATKERAKLLTDVPQVSLVVFAPAGNLVAVAGPSAPVEVWDVATGRQVHTFPTRSAPISRLAFRPDGRRLAGLTAGGSAAEWDLTTGKTVGVYRSPAVPGTPAAGPPPGGDYAYRYRPAVLNPQGIAFAPDGRLVGFGNVFQAVAVWDARTGDLVGPAGGLVSDVAALAFEPGGKALSAFAPDLTNRRWDPATGKELEPVRVRFEVGAAPVNTYGGYGGSGLTVSPDGKLAAAPTTSGGVSVFDLKLGEELFALPVRNPRGGVERTRVAFAPDGSKVLLAGSAYAYRAPGNAQPEYPVGTAWDTATGRKLPGLAIPLGESGAAAFTPDGTKVVAAVGRRDANNGSETVELTAWDAAGRRVAGDRLPAGFTTPIHVHVAADNRTAVVVGTRSAVAWDLTTGRVVRTSDVFAQPVSGPVAVSPDGRWLAVGGSESPVPLPPPLPGVVGQQVIVARLAQPAVHLLEAATLAHRASLTGHTGAITALAFSPDGATLASGAKDTQTLLWDLPAVYRGGPKAAAEPTPDALWAGLTGAPAAAWAAVRELVARPEVAIPLLREKLKPVAGPGAPDADAVAKLVAGLDAPAYADRERATKDLTRLAPVVLPTLRDALDTAGSPEVRERLAAVLDAAGKPDPLLPLHTRAVEVAEHAGTPAARALLADWAAGWGPSVLTQQAKAALARLGATK